MTVPRATNRMCHRVSPLIAQGSWVGRPHAEEEDGGVGEWGCCQGIVLQGLNYLSLSLCYVIVLVMMVIGKYCDPNEWRFNWRSEISLVRRMASSSARQGAIQSKYLWTISFNYCVQPRTRINIYGP